MKRYIVTFKRIAWFNGGMRVLSQELTANGDMVIWVA